MSLWGEFDFCPKCDHNNLWLNYFYIHAKNSPLINLRSTKRIGPHDINILYFIFGSLLGDSYAEKHGNGTRICFQQEGSHSAYLLWMHTYVSQLGYCNESLPKFTTRLGYQGKLRTILRFKTFTYTSFNWIRECFYTNEFVINKKILPSCIEEYLSPLALAVWIMDDGSKGSSGLKLATNNFSEQEVVTLINILYAKYNLKSSLQLVKNSALDINKQYIIYISKYSMSDLSHIVKPHLHPSMKYKLNGYL